LKQNSLELLKTTLKSTKNSKKGIVLLITIFFIIAIMVLVEKNLKTTDNFLSLKETNLNIKQFELSVNDINREILKMFKDKNSDILVNLPPIIPFSYGNIEVELYLSKYDDISHYLVDYNRLKVDDYFTSHIDKNRFLEVIKDKNITNQNQIDAVISEYITLTKDDEILKIKDNLTYFDTNESGYILCKYNLIIDGLEGQVKMVFKANSGKENVVKEQLEINIKR